MLPLANCAVYRSTARSIHSMFGSDNGSIRAESLGDDPAVLTCEFTSAWFSYDANAGASFMMSDISDEDLMAGKVADGQLLHVQVLWVPLAGNTPMDSSATNASIRYVVISNGEVGVYSGAGFAEPDDDLDSDRVWVTLADATLQLQESTAGFHDLLSPAQLSGSFTATRDEQKARQVNRAASQLVTNALGKTTFVRAN